MRQLVHQITIPTHGKGLYEITDEVLSWLRQGKLETGLLTVYVRHTSASLTIQENADPDVIRDLEAFFSRLVPENDSLYRHTVEGPDDMPAHVRSALTLTQISVPIVGGRPALGTWQGIYLFEHRRHAHRRTVVLHAIGE